MEEINAEKMDLGVTSLEITAELLNDFERKKKYFEDTISKMKNFNPNSISPNINNIKRSSPRLQNDKFTDGLDLYIIIDQMKYLYETNMKLINVVKSLNSKCDNVIKQNIEASQVNNDIKTELQNVEVKIKTVSDDNKVLKKNVNNPKFLECDNEMINGLQEKISKLEQNAVNDCVVMQGNKVDEIVREADANKDDIDKKIKEYLSSIFVDEDKHLIDNIYNVKIYGRNLKFLKLQLSNQTTKKQFIISIKKLRPNHVFVSEFLIQSRLKLFHEVRIFARDNKDKIDQVFTRNGNILYKDARTKKISIISSLNEITNTCIPITNTVNIN